MLKKALGAAAAAALLAACSGPSGDDAEETATGETTAAAEEAVASADDAATDLCVDFGPQTPRDITSAVGANPVEFPLAPPASEMNLCNIHTHTNAEHKGPDFDVFVDASDSGGYACRGTADLTEAELAAAPGAFEGVIPGQTIEVHWVHTTCAATPGEGLGACVPEGCTDPLLRVEAQTFLVVNDENALDFTDMAYDGNVVNGLHQAKMLPSNTGTPVQFLGSTTGPSYTQAVCSPAQVTWNVRPQCAKLDINSLHRWAESGNVFNETDSHGVRQLVTAPELLSTIEQVNNPQARAAVGAARDLGKRGEHVFWKVTPSSAGVAGVFGFAALFASSPALAASPIGNVGTAKADEGAFSYELRTGYLFDEAGDSNDGRFRMRQHIDYGFSDWYAIRIVAEQDKREGRDFDQRSFTFENRFQVFEKRKHGWDGGFRVMYGVGVSEGLADEIDVRFIANVPIEENWEWRHNTVLEHEVGSNADDGVTLEFRNQLTRKVGNFIPGAESTRFGIEMFNDFGNLRTDTTFSEQDHQLGPVLKSSWGNGVYIQTAYRAGLSEDAPNHLLKLFIGQKFQGLGLN